jgi:hypothetical protein
MATTKKILDYEDENIDAQNFYQLPRHIMNTSQNSAKITSHLDDELEQMAELIMS